MLLVFARFDFPQTELVANYFGMTRLFGTRGIRRGHYLHSGHGWNLRRHLAKLLD